MKAKIKNILTAVMAVLAIILVFSACSDEKKEVIYLRGLVFTYLLPKDYANNGILSYKISHDSIQRGSVQIYVQGRWVSWGGDEYNLLCDKYNDNKLWELPPVYPDYADKDSRFVISEYIHNIKVIALDDFDSNHSAGAELNDIVYFEWESPFDFIQNGYTFETGVKGNGRYSGKELNSFYHRRLDDKSLYPVKMVNSRYTSFYFEKKPEQSGIHEIKIILTFETCESETIVKVLFE